MISIQKLFITALYFLAATSALAQGNFTLLSGNNEVFDSNTGLIWKRCSEGQAWDVSLNNCEGIAGTYLYGVALQNAKTEKTTAKKWRVPSVKELLSITDTTQSNPTIDSVFFPNTTKGRYWTSTTYGGGNVVVVDFISAGIGGGSGRLSVRLVR